MASSVLPSCERVLLDRDRGHLVRDALARVLRRHEVEGALERVPLMGRRPVVIGEVPALAPDQDHEVRPDLERVEPPRIALRGVDAGGQRADVGRVPRSEQAAAGGVLHRLAHLRPAGSTAGCPRSRPRRAVRRSRSAARRTRLAAAGIEKTAGVWLRVQDGCVVELLEGVHEELPVAPDVGADHEALGHLLERVALDRRDHRAEELAQRLARLAVEVDEDEARPHLAVHRDEAVRRPCRGRRTRPPAARSVSAPSRSYCQPWYLHTNWRQLPLVSSRGKSVHTSLLPRWRQMLWNARISPSTPRTITTDVLATASSLVK